MAIIANALQAQGATGATAPPTPAQIVWNPGAYLQGLNSTYPSAAAPATMGAPAYYTQVWLPFLFVAILLYLLEKRRVRLRASASAGGSLQ